MAAQSKLARDAAKAAKAAENASKVELAQADAKIISLKQSIEASGTPPPWIRESIPWLRTDARDHGSEAHDDSPRARRSTLVARCGWKLTPLCSNAGQRRKTPSGWPAGIRGAAPRTEARRRCLPAFHPPPDCT